MRCKLYLVLPLFLLNACTNTNDTDIDTDSNLTKDSIADTYNGMPISEKEPDNYTGEYLELYQNNLPKLRGQKVNGVRQGNWISWHPTGAKASEGFYIDGKLEGFYTVYFDNGKVRHKGYYKNDQKHGNWKFYYQDGSLALDTLFNP